MGTTFQGSTYGNDTVYSLQDGAANTLHSFAGGKDGGALRRLDHG